MLCPEEAIPQWAEAEHVPMPGSIGTRLAELDGQLPEARYPNLPAPLEVTLTKTAYESWKTYAKIMRYDVLTTRHGLPAIDVRLNGTYGRIPVMALKVATLLAAIDWTPTSKRDAPRIEARHMQRGMQISESWRASAHRILGQGHVYEYERLEPRILHQIEQRAEGVSLRDLSKGMRDVSPEKIERVVKAMVRAETITGYDHKPQGGGRPTWRWRMAA